MYAQNPDGSMRYGSPKTCRDGETALSEVVPRREINKDKHNIENHLQFQKIDTPILFCKLLQISITKYSKANLIILPSNSSLIYFTNIDFTLYPIWAYNGNWIKPMYLILMSICVKKEYMPGGDPYRGQILR